MKVKLRLDGWMSDVAHALYQILFHCLWGRHVWRTLEGPALRLMWCEYCPKTREVRK